MKIAIITTVDHNVGDDFVREGVKYLLRQYFKNDELEFGNIHKHSPITVRHNYEKIRNLRVSRIIDNIIPHSFSKDKILEADLVVQSGAPVYWCHEVGGGHCYQNEWFLPLIRKRFLKSRQAKLINLAAGTCQKYHSNGTDFCGSCNKYMKEFYDLCKVTTVRDSLAKAVLHHLNVDVPLIPCSSIFAIDEFGLKKEADEYLVVNYMKGGAHYAFGQKIDFKKWQNEFKKMYFKLKKHEKIIFSCHSEKEVNEAKEIDANAEIFFQKNDYLAYMKFYAKAKFGIVNRVHGAFLMASYGKPSIVIGNDSRARMASEIGLQSVFVNDVDYDFLISQYEYLKNGAENFGERFRVKKEKAYQDYMKALSVL